MNLLSCIPATIPDEFADLLVQTKSVRIERIVSQGHASAEGFWYDQPDNEFVVLIQGAARLRFENELVDLRAGDWVDIPAGKRHRVEWTAPDATTIWLAVYYK